MKSVLPVMPVPPVPPLGPDGIGNFETIVRAFMDRGFLVVSFHYKGRWLMCPVFPGDLEDETFGARVASWGLEHRDNMDNGGGN